MALDLRGYNDSDKPSDPQAYVIQELSRDVEGVIKGLGYDRCVLVAHDWGGAIAWYFAYDHPEMLSQLIVMNIPHPAKFTEGITTLPQLQRSWYMFFFQLPWLPELFFQANDYKAIASAFQEMAIDKSAFTQADLEAFKDAAAKRGALTAMINYYRQIFPGLFLAQKSWSVLAVPTLMIWGENDTALGKELTYGTESYVMDFTLKYIPNCSHWVQQEKPHVVNEYMKEFLKLDC